MPVPVINIAQMREWESATWISGQTEEKVIRNVGKRIARRARKLTRAGDLILILAGKGHNGDDVRAAREHLDGRKVELLEVEAPENCLQGLELILHLKPALVIDGLFGIGLNRPLNVAWKKFIARVNEAQLRVLAVDVPSGLNADTGETFGAVIEAIVTLTVGAPKIGMLAQSAWPFVGRLEVADDVGLATCPLRSELNWSLPEDFESFPPPRKISSHKGDFGHVAILAGSFGFHGAAVLAARAAQRAQPGLVTVFTQEKVYEPVAAQLQAAMVNVWKPALALPEKTSAALIGPGLAASEAVESLKDFTRRLWSEAKFPVVVDASALDWLEAQANLAPGIRVITPHPGEAARLLGLTTQQVQGNRLQAVRELSKKFGGCWVVLKGHQTLISRSDGEVFVNPSGNPHLAQGGSGDALAGFIAGLLAQPVLQANAALTLRYAVWQHGAAADALQTRRRNWVIEELVETLGDAS